MQKALIVLVLLSVSLLSIGQAGFQKITYERALKKANSTGKLIFLQYESEKCDQCNEVGDKAFMKEPLSTRLTKEYIAIKMPATSPERAQIAGKFNLTTGTFATLYVDKLGRLIFRSPGTSSSVDYYTDDMKKAQEKYSKFLQLDADSTLYFIEGRKELDIIKRIIQNKSDLGQENDLLLMEYISLVPADSSGALSTIQFIARQAPALNTKPDQVMRRAADFNSAWFGMPMNERVSINSRVINKSIKAAAIERDEDKAKAVASFAGRTHQTAQAYTDAYDWNMMSYYRQTKTYEKYLPVAAAYYDRIFARVTPTLIYELDSARLKNNNMSNDKFPRHMDARSDFSQQMHNAASHFYYLDKENQYISQSLAWIKRSIDLNPTHNNKHLYACMLYTNGQSEEAIREETEVIALVEKLNSRGFSNTSENLKRHYTALEKMKSGLLLEKEDN